MTICGFDQGELFVVVCLCVVCPFDRVCFSPSVRSCSTWRERGQVAGAEVGGEAEGGEKGGEGGRRKEKV